MRRCGRRVHYYRHPYDDEQGYNPGRDPAEVDTSYYHPMVSDVLAMVKDCPGSDAVTRKIIGG